MRLALSLPFSIALAIPIASEAQVDPETHKLCLEAHDYIGCVDKNQISIKEARDSVNQDFDILKKPIVKNWIYYESPDLESVTYVNPETVKKVQVRSVFGRYFEFTYLQRERVPPVPATHGYYSEIQPERTTCQRAANKEVCTTYSAIHKWIPGSKPIPASVNEDIGYAIVDCKDRTSRWSESDKRWREAGPYFLQASINDFCDKVNTMKESKNMKYSEGLPTSDDREFLKV